MIKLKNLVFGDLEILPTSPYTRIKVLDLDYAMQYLDFDEHGYATPESLAAVEAQRVPGGRPSESSWLNSHAASKPFVGYLIQHPQIPNIRTIVPNPPGAAPFFYQGRPLKYLELINSSNTLGWPGTQGARVPGLSLTRREPRIKSPKPPVYLRPRLLSAREPVKRFPISLTVIPPTMKNGEGLLQFQLRLERWTERKRAREERISRDLEMKYLRRLEKYRRIQAINATRIADYDRKHQERLVKYKAALERYDREVRICKNPIFVNGDAYTGIKQDNPYGRVKMAFRGLPVYHFASTAGPLDRAPDGLDYYATYTAYSLSNKTPEELTAQYAENTRLMILHEADKHIKDLDLKIRRKIHQKLKNQSVHIGNLIAERKQTFDLLQSTFKRLLKLVELKRGALKAVVAGLQNPKQLADDVLAFKFGVEPLVKDIQSFAKYIDESTDSPIVVARSNSGGKIPISVSSPYMSFEGTVEISYTIKCMVENPAARSLSQFGLINPLEIAWEMVPWSFVVDWVLPVGDWLSSQTSDCGLRFVTGTRKVHLIGHFKATELPNNQLPTSPWDAGTRFHQPSLFTEFDGEVLGRTVLHSLPDVPLPTVKNPWSWSHGIESLALMVQRLKR